MFDQVYLCEKPSQARDIARQLQCHQKSEGYLSNDKIAVTWCFGHLLENAGPEHYRADLRPWRLDVLPIVPDEWHMQIKADCKKQFNVIQSLLKKTETVVIATDADREGELIAREVLTLCRFKGQLSRLWLAALDDKSIQKALQNLRDGKTTENLYFAGLSRARADWLVGMNLTMAATCALSHGSGVLSVGRVQTPTLRLLVERDEKIENFQSQAYFEWQAQFATEKNEQFWAKWQPSEKVVDEQGHCLQQEIVSVLIDQLNDQRGTVTDFQDEAKTQTPPLSLSLSQLQKLASSQFGLSAKATLDNAQALYEKHKAISYPRSDCAYLPENQWEEAPAVLSTLAKIDPANADWVKRCDPTQRTKIWNDKKITAHHAIIPLNNPTVNMAQFSEDELHLYKLITQYYLAQFLGDYHYRLRTIQVAVNEEHFHAHSHTPIQAGWKALLHGEDPAEDPEMAIYTTLPTVTPGQPVTLLQSEMQTKQTQPPSRFTEGTLIEAMKNIGKIVTDASYKKILKDTAGIGTEATRAAIIEVLLKRNYITRQKKQLISTPMGRELIVKLPKLVSDPLLTAQWEQALESVADGELSADVFLREQTTNVKTLLAAIKESGEQVEKAAEFQCPYCHQALRQLFSKKTNDYFWGCRGYPDCRATFPSIEGKPCFDPKQRGIKTAKKFPRKKSRYSA